MDHAEARELLEIAAVEPGGFDRLIAGDTIDAAALAGHVAGCSECAAEMESLRRQSAVIRDNLRSLPPPDLRERTLAFVAAVGRPRPALAAGSATGSTADRGAVVPLDIGAAPRHAPAAGADDRAGRVGRVGLWAASLVAAVVVAIVGTAFLVGQPGRDAAPDQIAALSRVAVWSLRIDGEADARHVDLEATEAAGAATSATLLFSPGTRELVVVAEGLTPPPAGQEYRCWMETDGERTRIGRMFFAGDIALWAGDVEALGELGGKDVTFGVTLVPAAGDSVDGDPILHGEL